MIETRPEEEHLVAVKQGGFRHINNPSEAVQLAAVKQNGWVIMYIKNPSEKIQLAAVKESKWALQHIKTPSEKVKAVHTALWEL